MTKAWGTDRVANAPKVVPHLQNGGLIGLDAGFSAGLDDGVGCLESVEGVDGVLHESGLVKGE
jgi:hypothetical protein